MQCIFGYCYKYTRATYDWFCGPGSHFSFQNLLFLHEIHEVVEQYHSLIKFFPSSKYDFSSQMFLIFCVF